MVLAGIIMAEAAIQEGNFAGQSQTYGPEARGGSSRSDVVLSDKEIDYPWNLGIDILVALTQQGYDHNTPDLKEEGLVIVDPEHVHRLLRGRTVGIPFRQIAVESGEERAINMAVLGALSAFCPFVSCGSLAKIMSKRLPSSKIEQSLRAFNKAVELAKRTKISFLGDKEQVEI